MIFAESKLTLTVRYVLSGDHFYKTQENDVDQTTVVDNFISAKADRNEALHDVNDDVCVHTDIQPDSKPDFSKSAPKNKWVALCLCFFLGAWGGHKFYEGKIGLGITYMLTLGFAVIGILIDLIVISTKPETYFIDKTV